MSPRHPSLASLRHGDLARLNQRAQGSRAPAILPVRRPAIALWLPTTAIFALLAPFAFLALPFLYLAPRRYLPKPAQALAGLGQVLFSLRGTQVDVDSPRARVRLRLI